MRKRPGREMKQTWISTEKLKVFISVIFSSFISLLNSCTCRDFHSAGTEEEFIVICCEDHKSDARLEIEKQSLNLTEYFQPQHYEERGWITIN